MSGGIQFVHNPRARLPYWWCDDCGRFGWIQWVSRTPFRGRMVTELSCYACTLDAVRRENIRKLMERK